MEAAALLAEARLPAVDQQRLGLGVALAQQVPLVEGLVVGQVLVAALHLRGVWAWWRACGGRGGGSKVQRSEEIMHAGTHRVEPLLVHTLAHHQPCRRGWFP